MPPELTANIFLPAHKAVRWALLQTICRVGATDGDDRSAVDEAIGATRDLLQALQVHSSRETEGVQVLMARYTPELLPEMVAGHERGEAAEHALAELLDAIAAADADGREGLLDDLYRRLASLAAWYLEHLEFEEREVGPALHTHLTTAEIAAHLAPQMGGPPQETIFMLQFMLPGMNPGERAHWLGGMLANASAEVSELYWSTAKAALDDASYRTLEARLAAGATKP